MNIEVLASDFDWASDSESMPPVCAMPRLAGHRSQWLAALGDGFGHRGYLIRASDATGTKGLLPVVYVKGPIFGKFLVSLPYLNTGGVWAATTNVATALVDAACDLSDQLDVKYLELRHEVPLDHPKLNFDRTDKVHMRLKLPETDAIFEDKSLKSKVRSQIKKADVHELSVHFGGNEFVGDFYDVFARNMRDLGTPVFAKRLFASIVRRFDGDAEFCVVRKAGQTIAAGLITHESGVSEVPSASCLRDFNHTNANMMMYRHLIRRSIEKGSQTFDFGRSSQGSGTYRFKAQWGALPHEATWQYYVRKGDPNDMRPDAGGNQRLIRVWQKLPVWLTRLAGPMIVRGIP
ncbi:FemAB family protein [Rubripirellula tenax]|uniref:FemAB family protein n=2 Tax=Rubripirellula tenax TaxID=2528015 RepID=A0A5C6F2B7_9BACT|nr:FemAB family protein [Rubripirellula tenax]